jgi:hypothetical protein
MTETNTAIPGAEPGDKKPTAIAGAEPEIDATSASSPEKQLPFDKDPRWKSARLAEQKLEGILKANDLEDVDDLIALIESGRKVHGKVDDIGNIEDIIKKAATLDRYEAHWAREREAQRRQSESPEETIARLERDKVALETSKASEARAKKEADEAEKAVTFYENEVKSIINGMEDLIEPERLFLAWALGVGNESNEITITDKKEVRKAVNNGRKRYADLVAVLKKETIESYLAGKEKVPLVPSGGQVPATTPATTLNTAKRRLAAAQEYLVKK